MKPIDLHGRQAIPTLSVLIHQKRKRLERIDAESAQLRLDLVRCEEYLAEARRIREQRGPLPKRKKVSLVEPIEVGVTLVER